MNEHHNSDVTAKLVHVSGFLDFLNPGLQEIVMLADVIIFQRNMVDETAFDAMEYFQGMGKPVVIDLDDAYHILPWSNPAHKFWHEHEEGKALLLLEEGLKRSNGLITPNRLLLYDWKHVAKGYYLPNYANHKFWPEDLPTRDEMKTKLGFQDRIVFGWGGSVSHYDSWWGSGIREAAIRVTNRHPELLWVICGNDSRIFDQLPLSSTNKFQQQGVDPSIWPTIIRSFDVGLAPLFGPYDQRRSWIKGLEYLLAGVPWIGTVGEPYADLQGLGVLIRNGIEEWEDGLENIIKDLKQSQEIFAQNVPTARQWLAINQVKTYKSVYNEISQDAGIKGRLPGIFYV